MTAEFSGIALPMEPRPIAFRSVCGLEGVRCSPISIHRESHAPPRSALAVCLRAGSECKHRSLHEKSAHAEKKSKIKRREHGEKIKMKFRITESLVGFPFAFSVSSVS